jgi:hypothetical protein
MPAQFDVNTSLVADCSQFTQNGLEVNLALSEHQMFVHAFPHVFDMNIPEAVTPVPEVRGDRQLLLAMKVANVNRQSEFGAVHSFGQLAICMQGINKHTWLRLERQSHVRFAGFVAELPTRLY